MPNWKGIVGRGFRPHEFKEYLGTLNFTDWRPQFVVLHNTASPRLSQWHSHPGEERMHNLEAYYRSLGWSAGPHLFVADDLIWAFTSLTTPGVHSPSWNSVAWGIEMVGDYNAEPFNPAVRENAVDAVSLLHLLRGLDPDTIRFHKEDPRTDHDCPGKNVVKSDFVERVKSRMAGGREEEHIPTDNYLDIGAEIIARHGALARAIAVHRLRFADIFATEFGGGSEAGMESAYDGEIDRDQPQASLPARLDKDPAKRRILVLNPTNGYTVVCFVNDVGPWNTRDAYWKTETRPRAEAQFILKQKADNKQVPSNPAGLDLTGAAYEALGLSGTINTRSAKLDWDFV
jgi:N-acetylmuramoyl-L-alanine amidase